MSTRISHRTQTLSNIKTLEKIAIACHTLNELYSCSDLATHIKDFLLRNEDSTFG